MVLQSGKIAFKHNKFISLFRAHMISIDYIYMFRVLFFDRNNKIDTKDSHVWVGMTIFSFSRFWPVIYTNYLRCKLNNSDVSCVKSWASPFFSSLKVSLNYAQKTLIIMRRQSIIIERKWSINKHSPNVVPAKVQTYMKNGFIFE